MEVAALTVDSLNSIKLDLEPRGHRANRSSYRIHFARKLAGVRLKCPKQD